MSTAEGAGGDALAGALATLEVVLLERDAGGSFRVHGRPPGWFRRLAGEAREGLEPALLLPFLESFLQDAETVWCGERAVATSGAWTEVLDEAPGVPREELVLEARALCDDEGRALLLLQRATARFDEQRRILQRARAALLEYERLRKEVDRKELLLHCIVHDLRGPLSGMVGTMSLVQSSRLSIEAAHELLEVGLEQARYQESMIRSILEAFAAEVRDLEAFESTAATAPDLRAAIEAVAKRYASAFRTVEVELRTEVAAEWPAPLPVVGRADRLERVLENLLENALRYAPTGSTVAVTVPPPVEAAEAVHVTVEDRGPGIPEDVRARLFDRFAQGQRAKGVAGLGLYFCRSTLALWGGAIEAEPRAGGGTCFRVRLRLAR